MIRPLGLILTLGACIGAAQSIPFTPVAREVVEKRLAAYVTKNDGREPAVRKIFEDAGCSGEKLTEQPVRGVKAPNLICGLHGKMESSIIVGAHFDLEEAGHGVVDNWSGASLLPSLYQGLASTPREHTFRFVAFSGEEKGLLGSKAYVRDMAKTKESVAAMINLDTLGLAETEVWASRADPQLVNLIRRVAGALELPLSAVNVEQVGSTDSEPFREKKVPTITIHSLTQETLPLLHSPRDRIEAIRMDEYYRTYRLVLAYLAVIDQNLK